MFVDGGEDGARHCWVADACIEVSGGPPDKRVGKVLGYGIHEPAKKPDFDAIFDIFAQENITDIRFRVPPTPNMAEIIEWLTERGFRRVTKAIQLLASTEPERPVVTEYLIRRIGEEDAVQFAEIIFKNYANRTPEAFAHYKSKLVTPDVTCFMAFDGETPIGTGVINSHGLGCAFGYGTTLGPYRKRGLQNAMIAYRLNYARTMGHDWACALTFGNDRSSRNLQRQGFKKAYELLIYGNAAK